MREIKDIVNAFDAAKSQNLQTALATVVHVEGSSYRRPGARMLVTEDGQLTGAISGGCLEGDVLEKARKVMSEQKSRLVTYDTTAGTNTDLEIGLGCNGIIHILIESIDPGDPNNPVQLFKEFFSKRQSAVLMTLFSMKNKTLEQPGTCLFITENGKARGQLADDKLLISLMQDAEEVLKTRTSLTKIYRSEDELTGFVELLEPAISLIVTGAGNDTIPLMRISDILGWEMTVIDCRSHYLTEERFPGAKKIIADNPEEVVPQLTPDHRTAAVLMTHNYKYDLGMLRKLLPLKLPFIGLLGPRKRTNQMLSELRDEDLFSDESQIRHIFGPVGLDIGAETSEEIALSVVAEIKTVFADGTGAHLREKQEPIHSRESDIFIL